LQDNAPHGTLANVKTGKEPTAEERAVGDVLRQLRLKHGLTTTVVAYRLAMSEQNYRHYESGRNQLNLLQVSDFAWALEADPRELLEHVYPLLRRRDKSPEPAPTIKDFSFEGAARSSVDSVLVGVGA
jgi:transcriptional regulator with XRE-family HTH domain